MRVLYRTPHWLTVLHDDGVKRSYAPPDGQFFCFNGRPVRPEPFSFDKYVRLTAGPKRAMLDDVCIWVEDDVLYHNGADGGAFAAPAGWQWSLLPTSNRFRYWGFSLATNMKVFREFLQGKPPLHESFNGAYANFKHKNGANTVVVYLNPTPKQATP